MSHYQHFHSIHYLRRLAPLPRYCLSRPGHSCCEKPVLIRVTQSQDLSVPLYLKVHKRGVRQGSASPKLRMQRWFESNHLMKSNVGYIATLYILFPELLFPPAGIFPSQEVGKIKIKKYQKFPKDFLYEQRLVYIHFFTKGNLLKTRRGKPRW